MNDVQQIQVSRNIEAPVERVFPLLADPDRHPDLDGSGTLRASRTHTVITEVGDVLIMDLNTEDHGDYQCQSVVTTYVRDRALGWSPGPVDDDPFGDTFTFTLEPDGDDRTPGDPDLRLVRGHRRTTARDDAPSVERGSDQLTRQDRYRAVDPRRTLLLAGNSSRMI